MAYSIEFTAAAKRQFDKLPGTIRQRLVPLIDRLGENPRSVGARKLSGEEGRLLVLVVKVGHRREVYR